MGDPSCNGLFSALIDFDKAGLKNTESLVKTIDGRQLLETRDAKGRTTTKLVAEGILGYVGEVKQDLQVIEVAPGLLMGSQDVAHDMDLLKKNEITHILNVATRVEDLYEEDFVYKDIELLDMPETNIMAAFPEAFEFIDSARSTGGRVYVHCNAGVSRSSTIVIAYLMKTTGVSFKECFKRMREMRPAVCPNAGFMAQLEYHEEILAGKT